MISKQDEAVLTVALASEKIAAEIVARAISASADPAAAAALLAVISDSAKERKEIKEYLTVAMASRSAASEICDQLNLVVECLQYQAADNTANNAALAAAQAKVKALSSATKEILVICVANRAVSSRIAAKIDASGQVIAAIAAAI